MSNPTLVGYLTVRRGVGILGIALPFILWWGGSIFFDIPRQDDISSYYHTSMGDVFVGALAAIAVLLFSYRGYPRGNAKWWEVSDNAAANIAGALAIGVALFPVAPENAPTETVERIHIICATGLFLMFAYFCIVLFAKCAAAAPKAVYYTCGAVIVSSIIWTFWRGFGSDGSLFVPETLAIVAFGVSWLVKGKALGSF